jgi:acetyl-CoA decarbonylase/synthase, CODH/ACS complex subunit gamma
MALSGLEIYKKLPKTNCGDCGVPTCMAFAMKLAAGQAELSACPHVSPEAAEALGAASAPPIRPITIGAGPAAFKIGGETVLFRHEKTFVNPPGIAVLVTDAMSEADVNARLKAFAELQYDRVGLKLKANLIAVKSNDPAKLTALAQKAGAAGAAVMLMSESADALKAAATAIKDKKPLLYAATKANADAVGAVAKETGLPLVVKGDGLEGIVELTEKLTKLGIKDLLIDTGTRQIKKALEEQVQIRRLAIKKTFRPLGYPTVVIPAEMTQDPITEALYASIFVAKYGGIIVLSNLNGETLFPLVVARMNIYTDPQRPMATQKGIYPINNPNENSPVLVTSNFSLTYFIVSGELESSRLPVWLVVVDTEGLSVLTAWAAGKFAADIVGAYVLKCGITDKIKHKKLIIPGAVASISGELEDEMKGWEIMIGPREASHITPYLKERFPA